MKKMIKNKEHTSVDCVWLYAYVKVRISPVSNCPVSISPVSICPHTDFCRHLVGKNAENVCHCDSA